MPASRTIRRGIERDHLRPNDRVELMGIGSGINLLMLGMEWQCAPLGTQMIADEPAAAGRQAVK